MIVYIAAPYPIKKQAIALRNVLSEFSIDTTSRWLDVPDGTTMTRDLAFINLADIRSSDAVVLMNTSEWKNVGTGGRHTEVGYAVALGKPVYLLGNVSNVFHLLEAVRVCATEVELIDQLLNYAPPQVPMHGDMLNAICRRVHLANERWWRSLDTGERIHRNIGELLMLTVSELAEAMEGHRKDLPDDKLPHRTMFEVELADAIIRIADICGGLGLDLGGAFEEKMRFNAMREDHTAAHRLGAHGKKY